MLVCMRKSFRSALAAVLVACVLAPPSFAEDRRKGGNWEGPISSNWGGFYVGIYTGRAWGDADLRTDTGAVTASSYFQFPENTASVNQAGSGALSPDAGLAGVQVGINTQKGGWVFGLEADYGVFNLGASRGAAGVPYPALGSVPFKYSVRAEMETDWLATARARVGWAFQPGLLLYATGGLAVTNIRVSNSFSDDAPEQGVGGSSSNELKAGWTLGGGAEWALARNWSLKAEYLYLNFGSASASSSINCGPAVVAACAAFAPPVTPSPFSTSADLSAHIARVGLNYKF
jgi:outer membrane immunogenic protein